MNEITSKPISPVVQGKSLAKGAVATPVERSTGTSASPSPVGSEKHTAEPTKHISEHVEAAVKQMNEYIQSTQRDLHFSYDKASGETVVKVLDRKTQEVIRQIPDETFLKLAQAQVEDGGLTLFSAQA